MNNINHYEGFVTTPVQCEFCSNQVPVLHHHMDDPTLTIPMCEFCTESYITEIFVREQQALAEREGWELDLDIPDEDLPF